MAINYNAGFLPQQLYQNIFDIQRAGLQERNQRQRDQFKNLGSIVGKLGKYNVEKGDQQLKDFEERYKTQRDQLVNLRNTADPRTEDYKNVQDQINLLDQDYANMQQEFNQTGFLNMGRDQSVLDLPDRTGTFAKKLINPRTGVPFIGGPGKAFDDEPIGYFQPANVRPESTKEAYALRDKQALEGFLQKNRLTLQDDAQAYGTGERLGRQEFQTGEREAGQEYGTSERLGKQEFQTGERLGGENFKDLQRALGQAFQKNERIGRQGFLTGEREAGQEYGTSERLGKQKFQTGEREDSQQFKLDYLRESVGLDTGKALAVLNLQNEIKKEQLRLEDKLKTASPAEIERNRQDKYKEAMFKLLEQMTPEGGFIDELERQNAFSAAREITDEIYGPLGGGASMPSPGDLRGEPAAQTQSPAQQTQGMLPQEARPLDTDIIEQGLQLAEQFPGVAGAGQMQQMASEYLTILTSIEKEPNPETQIQMQQRLVELQQQMQPVFNQLETISKLPPRQQQQAKQQPVSSKKEEREFASDPRSQRAKQLNERRINNASVQQMESTVMRLAATANAYIQRGVDVETAQRLKAAVDSFRADPENMESTRKAYQNILAINQRLGQE